MERTITKGPITVTSGPITVTSGPITTYPANAILTPPLLHSENLLAALDLAIEAQEKKEKEEMGYFLDSCMLASWKQSREALRRGQLPVVKLVGEL